MTEQSREEKTEELRDLFMEVTDESTVTEEKEETRGTLKDKEEIDEEIGEVVDEMVEEYGINTKLDHDELVKIVRGFHEGDSDTEIADELGDKSLNKTVGRVRVKLHLFRDSDSDAPFELELFRRDLR
ncbi:MAG: conditioned medium-induced protein 4, partial [Halobacteria archaeon]|nr:conditioned medium-induced protein 4 [Halobacteria archaeon]